MVSWISTITTKRTRACREISVNVKQIHGYKTVKVFKMASLTKMEMTSLPEMTMQEKKNDQRIKQLIHKKKKLQVASALLFQNLDTETNTETK